MSRMPKKPRKPRNPSAAPPAPHVADTLAPMPLYVIDEELERFEADFLDAGGDISEALLDQYAELLEMKADKIGRYLAVIDRMEATASAARERANRLALHASRFSKSADRLRDRIRDKMLARGEKRHETPLGTVRVQRNSTRPVELLVSEDELPERFTRTETSPMMQDLADALKAGDDEALALARFGEAGFHLRIS